MLTSSFPPPGPVVQNVKETKLAASRQTANTPAGTRQPLTHYHSLFSELLSWNNPRTL